MSGAPELKRTQFPERLPHVTYPKEAVAGALIFDSTF